MNDLNMPIEGPFQRVLIANRGEIACRIISAAQFDFIGLETVAVYSDADAHARHVRLADEAVYIGPSAPNESYLRIDKLIDAALQMHCDCVHPGYGFLAENPEFADAVQAAGLAFIGPSGAAMRALGEKASAKEIARAAGVPTIPGYDGDDQSPERLASEAAGIGYPVMIKAVAGGGGRGMRRVHSPNDFADALESAKREAQGAFGNDRMLIEKLLETARHIEVQVFGDSHGQVVHFYERDCSLQRRNQKIIEEAPAPGMSPVLRQKMCEAAVRLAKHVNYENAGTVEFLVEGVDLHNEANWYFIEMNTRLQVEHPVTEIATGHDLVRWQFLVAGGHKLPAQAQIDLRDCAVEARICAENPRDGFRPQSGKLLAFQMHTSAPNHRVDTGFEAGDVVPEVYDSLLAKAIGSTASVFAGRDSALETVSNMLRHSKVLGPHTNMELLERLLSNSDVRAGRIHTRFIEETIDQLLDADRPGACGFGGALLLRERAAANTSGHDDWSPWCADDGFQLSPSRQTVFDVVQNGAPQRFIAVWDSEGFKTGHVQDAEPGRDEVHGDGAEAPLPYPVAVDLGAHDHVVADGRVYVLEGLRQAVISWPDFAVSETAGDTDDTVRAPINGRVAKLFVTAGQAVAAGARIAIVEAMKMEHVLTSPREGMIANVHVAEGDQVSSGAVVAALSPAVSG